MSELLKCRSIAEVKSLLRSFNIKWTDKGKLYALTGLPEVPAQRVGESIKFTIKDFHYLVIHEEEYKQSFKNALQAMAKEGAIVYGDKPIVVINGIPTQLPNDTYWCHKLLDSNHRIYKVRAQYYK